MLSIKWKKKKKKKKERKEKVLVGSFAGSSLPGNLSIVRSENIDVATCPRATAEIFKAENLGN